MESIAKSKRKAFILAVLLSVGLVAGIPMIVVGAVNGGLFKIMMGFGIVMTALERGTLFAELDKPLADTDTKCKGGTSRG